MIAGSYGGNATAMPPSTNLALATPFASGSSSVVQQARLLRRADVLGLAHTSSSRHLLGNGSCTACEHAALCYSIACKDGKMSTEGPFKKCAAAQEACNSCFPNSTCGSLPSGATRPPTATPLPAWGKANHSLFCLGLLTLPSVP